MNALSIDNGFHEAVAIVADLQSSGARIAAATGFRRRMAGPVDPAALALLGLAGRSAEEAVFGHPETTRGAIRLLQLDGPAPPCLREGGQAWDSGGIFDINLRALPSIDALHARFMQNGFFARAPITDWDFGPLAVREVVEDDADGLCIALMERVRPALTGYEGLSGPASWVFNSTQIVRDFGAARRFYTETLGWLPVQETQGMAAQENGANCMGLPVGLAATIPMQIGIYHPHGRMEGSVEIIEYGCEALDFSDHAPPMRGWAALRFPVSDLDAVLACASGAACRVIGPIEMDWRPYGSARAAALVTPWGVRLEFVELI